MNKNLPSNFFDRAGDKKPKAKSPEPVFTAPNAAKRSNIQVMAQPTTNKVPNIRSKLDDEMELFAKELEQTTNSKIIQSESSQEKQQDVPPESFQDEEDDLDNDMEMQIIDEGRDAHNTMMERLDNLKRKRKTVDTGKGDSQTNSKFLKSSALKVKKKAVAGKRIIKSFDDEDGDSS